MTNDQHPNPRHPDYPNLILVGQGDHPDDNNGDPIILATIRLYVDPDTEPLTLARFLIGLAHEMLNPE